jgi:hypothetical protein
LLAAIDAASQDFAWVIDDDDYVHPSAFQTLRSALWGGEDTIAALATQVVEERWESLSPGRAQLLSTTCAELLRAAPWHTAFSGVNSLPICGYVFPVSYARERLKTYELSGNLSEDYALLLLLLTGANLPEIVLVEEPLAYISKRGSDESVMWLQDRTAWAADIGEYLGELQSSSMVASSGIWQLGRTAATMPVPAVLPTSQLESEISRLRVTLSKLASERVVRTEEVGVREVVDSTQRRPWLRWLR